MRRFFKPIIAVSVLLLALLLLDFYGRDIAVWGGALAGSERLSLWERFELPRRVNAGDILAAKRLAGYYGIWRNDTEGMMYWMKRSAELGDPVDQYNYGVYLTEKKQDKVEGLKWITKSANSGYEYAKDYLKEEKQSGAGQQYPRKPD